MNGTEKKNRDLQEAEEELQAVVGKLKVERLYLDGLKQAVSERDARIKKLREALERLLKFAKEEMDIPHWDWFKGVEEQAQAALAKEKEKINEPKQRKQKGSGSR